MRKSISIRLSEEVKQLRRLLSLQFGISHSAVMELAICELAEKSASDAWIRSRP